MHLFQPLHHIAKHRPHGTAAGAGFLFQLVFITGLCGGAHHHSFELFVIRYAGDIRIILQHALIAQKPQRQIFGIIPDRHRRDNFLRVKKNRQWAFFDH